MIAVNIVRKHIKIISRAIWGVFLAVFRHFTGFKSKNAAMMKIEMSDNLKTPGKGMTTEAGNR